MMKTAVVEVSYEKKHSKYLKYYTVTRRFKAHNENDQYKTGDVVTIEECRPLSKDKRFTIVGLVKKAINPEV
jgi:small subunit ribosomal protein S17